MPIGIIDQHKLLDGTISPPTINLYQLVSHTSYSFAKKFFEEYKEFLTEQEDVTDPNNPVIIKINQNAYSYKRKMLKLSNQIITGANSNTLEKILKLIVLIIADNYTLQQVENAHNQLPQTWESFIGENIGKAFELFAGVYREEKEEYDNVTVLEKPE